MAKFITFTTERADEPLITIRADLITSIVQLGYSPLVPKGDAGKCFVRYNEAAQTSTGITTSMTLTEILALLES